MTRRLGAALFAVLLSVCGASAQDAPRELHLIGESLVEPVRMRVHVHMTTEGSRYQVAQALRIVREEAPNLIVRVETEGRWDPEAEVPFFADQASMTFVTAGGTLVVEGPIAGGVWTTTHRVQGGDTVDENVVLVGDQPLFFFETFLLAERVPFDPTVRVEFTALGGDREGGEGGTLSYSGRETVGNQRCHRLLHVNATGDTQAEILLDDDHRLVEATLNGQEELRAVSEADADAFLRRP